MTFDSLREFILDLERRNELIRVSEPVSTSMKMTEIQTRLLSDRGPAVIFENSIRADGTKSNPSSCKSFRHGGTRSS